MSDRDDPEGFDREAQKRELREKYARDAEDRERTGRMSELLLQGATMTNKHCDRCGNPLFRHEGREFCPTCQAEGEPDAGATEAGANTDAGASPTAAHADETPTDADATAAADASDEDAATAIDDGASRPSTGPPTTSVTNVADVEAEAPETHTHDARAEPAENGATTGPAAPDRVRDDGIAHGTDPSGDASGDVPAARAALSRSVARLAERAAAADDPRRARELAEAAREAAEALDALR
ncbi:uncharacterized Zn finger protein (UPF0148 family) [Halarchaeum solikamskense]|uniref:Sjogren's syndrome/scleroderma autoantigen 1 family protein n=1 Tax=Halarchaeum nitratireducens TaxID=489913 RepID=UPI001B3ACD89|nr:Sjogren's syndrome/scleroderma autoantigen 1 family protein [Halarchaeum solikamskense]MBP2252040.1 uncharacterized Zn finger protein (UPF0148 family) [Halarchaeum solikamskense]